MATKTALGTPSNDYWTVNGPRNGLCRGTAVATKLAEEIDFRQIDDFIAAPAQNRLKRE